MLEKKSVPENEDTNNGFSHLGMLTFSLIFLFPLLTFLAASLLHDKHSDIEAIQSAKNIDSLISDYENCIPDKDVGLFLFKGVTCKNKKDALVEAARKILFLNMPSIFPDKKKYPDAYAKVQESIKNAIFKFIKYKHYDLAFSSLYYSRNNIDPAEVAPAINEIIKKENVIKSNNRYESLIDYTPTSVVYYLSEKGLTYELYTFSSSLINDYSDQSWVSADLATSIARTLLSFGCKDDFVSWSSYLIRLYSFDDYEKSEFSKYYFDLIKDLDSEKMSAINKNTSWLIDNKKTPSLSASCELKPHHELARNTY